ncbi:hypothetical protein T265_05771 [Opisthorchis viverrini]|uniref:non-specific serine/threonine protein kinase n=1 Tax=Opisthorchis viverrini TaxID=6198 RepID=A0A074ZN66_OPIVI|nr:hypothetical protein T265_05771 [Opisthorchis viverrini]KER27162.1 hypothetical protein T265_05771 [Opisthorchis viverrini]
MNMRGDKSVVPDGNCQINRGTRYLKDPGGDHKATVQGCSPSQGSKLAGELMSTSTLIKDLLAPGDLIKDRWRVVRKLGGGGFGEIYEAVDTKFQHEVPTTPDSNESLSRLGRPTFCSTCALRCDEKIRNGLHTELADLTQNEQDSGVGLQPFSSEVPSQPVRINSAGVTTYGSLSSQQLRVSQFDQELHPGAPSTKVGESGYSPAEGSVNENGQISSKSPKSFKPKGTTAHCWRCGVSLNRNNSYLSNIRHYEHCASSDSGISTFAEAADYRVAIKVESNRQARQVLRMEVAVLRRLQGKSNVCQLFGCGKNTRFNYMVMTLQGKNLAELRRLAPNSNFSLSTALRIVIQCLDALRTLHEAGFLHRDVKPSNFTVQRSRNSSLPGHLQVVVVDFGLARPYTVNGPGTEVRNPRPVAGFRGTVRYASVNAHEHRDLGRRDDIWSLFYVMVEFVAGQLPWRRIRDKELVGQMKLAMDNKELAIKSGLPHVVTNKWTSHLSSLDYKSKPDYKGLADVLHSWLKDNGVQPSDMYDWEQGIAGVVVHTNNRPESQRLHCRTPVKRSSSNENIKQVAQGGFCPSTLRPPTSKHALESVNDNATLRRPLNALKPRGGTSNYLARKSRSVNRSRAGCPERSDAAIVEDMALDTANRSIETLLLQNNRTCYVDIRSETSRGDDKETESPNEISANLKWATSQHAVKHETDLSRPSAEKTKNNLAPLERGPNASLTQLSTKKDSVPVEIQNDSIVESLNKSPSIESRSKNTDRQAAENTGEEVKQTGDKSRCLGSELQQKSPLFTKEKSKTMGKTTASVDYKAQTEPGEKKIAVTKEYSITKGIANTLDPHPREKIQAIIQNLLTKHKGQTGHGLVAGSGYDDTHVNPNQKVLIEQEKDPIPARPLSSPLTGRPVLHTKAVFLLGEQDGKVSASSAELNGLRTSSDTPSQTQPRMAEPHYGSPFLRLSMTNLAQPSSKQRHTFLTVPRRNLTSQRPTLTLDRHLTSEAQNQARSESATNLVFSEDKKGLENGNDNHPFDEHDFEPVSIPKPLPRKRRSVCFQTGDPSKHIGDAFLDLNDCPSNGVAEPRCVTSLEAKFLPQRTMCTNDTKLMTGTTVLGPCNNLGTTDYLSKLNVNRRRQISQNKLTVKNSIIPPAHKALQPELTGHPLNRALRSTCANTEEPIYEGSHIFFNATDRKSKQGVSNGLLSRTAISTQPMTANMNNLTESTVKQNQQSNRISTISNPQFFRKTRNLEENDIFNQNKGRINSDSNTDAANATFKTRPSVAQYIASRPPTVTPRSSSALGSRSGRSVLDGSNAQDSIFPTLHKNLPQQQHGSFGQSFTELIVPLSKRLTETLRAGRSRSRKNSASSAADERTSSMVTTTVNSNGLAWHPPVVRPHSADRFSNHSGQDGSTNFGSGFVGNEYPRPLSRKMYGGSSNTLSNPHVPQGSRNQTPVQFYHTFHRQDNSGKPVNEKPKRWRF